MSGGPGLLAALSGGRGGLKSASSSAAGLVSRSGRGPLGCGQRNCTCREGFGWISRSIPLKETNVCATNMYIHALHGDLGAVRQAPPLVPPLALQRLVPLLVGSRSRDDLDGPKNAKLLPVCCMCVCVWGGGGGGGALRINRPPRNRTPFLHFHTICGMDDTINPKSLPLGLNGAGA